LSHEVRTHTRRTKSGTVTVRQHKADDPAAEQKKRHAFEARVQRERSQAEAQQLRERQAGEALYEKKPGTRKPRTPGERKRRKARLKPARAKRNAKKALRLWRKHKVKAVLFAALAAGEIAAWAGARTAAGARKAIGRLRKTKGKGKAKR
jgi:hypothetical protein